MADDVLEGRGVTPPWKLSVTRTKTGGALQSIPEDATDRDLVRATLDGSADAFDRIVSRHRKGIYQLCYRYVGRHEDANDLTQDVFLRAYRGLKHFKGRSSLTTWLYRIGVNVCLTRVTSKAAKLDQAVPLERLGPMASNVESPADGVLRQERAQKVREAIVRLPPRQRATLVLRVYQELSHEEIAHVLGTSVGACKANLFHALSKLKVLLQS